MEACALDHDDERRGAGVAPATEQAVVGVGEVEADDEQRAEVDYRYPPERRLDRARQRPPRVLGLGRGEADEFRPGCARKSSASASTPAPRYQRRSPPKEKAAVTKTAATPWKPSASGPGETQYLPPT